MATNEVTRTWDNYAREAEAADFVLKTADGEIRITNPTGARIKRVAQGMRAGDLDLILLGLTGDAYQDVTALVDTAGHKAMPKLVEDLMEHFDMYEEIELQGPGGGTVTATKPREVKRLLAMGYTPKGG